MTRALASEGVEHEEQPILVSGEQVVLPRLPVRAPRAGQSMPFALMDCTNVHTVINRGFTALVQVYTEKLLMLKCRCQSLSVRRT